MDLLDHLSTSFLCIMLEEKEEEVGDGEEEEEEVEEEAEEGEGKRGETLDSLVNVPQ